VAQTVSEFGGIDILVANAGVLWLGPIESTPLKRWQRCLDVNLTGVFWSPRPSSRTPGPQRRIADRRHHHRGRDARRQRLLGVQGRGRTALSRLAEDLKPDNIAVNS
jgi:NAD(P)-dependent dehydrogenase (short-subunit alcohol dehydrogenase family)